MAGPRSAPSITAPDRPEPGALYTPDMWTLYEQILGAPDTPMYSTFLADGRGIPDRVGLDKRQPKRRLQSAGALPLKGT